MKWPPHPFSSLRALRDVGPAEPLSTLILTKVCLYSQVGLASLAVPTLVTCAQNINSGEKVSSGIITTSHYEYEPSLVTIE